MNLYAVRRFLIPHVVSQAHLEKTENEILQLSQNAVNLKSNFVELKEMKHVLEKAQVFLTEVRRLTD